MKVRTLYLAILFMTFQLTCLAQGKPLKARILNLTEVINSKVFPKALKKKSQEGKVVMDIWLGRNGDILKYKTVIAENKELAAYIESRVPELLFTPARDAMGVAIYSKVRLPFEFTNIDPKRPFIDK